MKVKRESEVEIVDKFVPIECRDILLRYSKKNMAIVFEFEISVKFSIEKSFVTKL